MSRVKYDYVSDNGKVIDLETVNEEMLEYAEDELGMDPQQLGPKVEHVVSFIGVMILHNVENAEWTGDYITDGMFDAFIESYNHLNKFPDDFIELMREFLVNRYDFDVFV